MDIVFLLGDQLTPDFGALKAADKADAIVLMAEVGAEAEYAWHHKQKLVLVISAMRHFAAELRALGWTVDYVELTSPDNTHVLKDELARAVGRHKPAHVHIVEAAEWRLRSEQDSWQDVCGVPVTIHDDTRFIASHAEFKRWASGRKQWTMEFFYREMRRKTGLLLDVGGEPVGGKWNFDAENRKPAQADLFLPKPITFAPDDITKAVIEMVGERFAKNPGKLESFGYAVTRSDAEAARDYFLEHLLEKFGDFQDAMLVGEHTLYHSILSPYINLGLIDPLDLCRRVEAEYVAGRAPLNAVEGFIRQIIGWREYVRGVYWHEMPAYRDRNALEATRPLPWFYWSGETDMRCLSEAIGQTLDTAYAHHIQRLMITGNFALIAGIAPVQVHEWYLAIYADAYEWVELPNTLGMSQFGDGGLLGSKPYAASANYISKMSNYCASCAYDPKKRHGPKACPFNALYWDFMVRHRKRFAANNRMSRSYMVWDRFDEAEQQATLGAARAFLGKLDADAAQREKKS